MAARRRYRAGNVLSEEYSELGPRRDRLQPEQKLMLAILEDALAKYQSYWLTRDRLGKKLFEELEQWFMAEDCAALYSFETICATLDIDPNCLRTRVRAWKSAAIEHRLTGGQPFQKLLLHSRKKAGL